MDEVGYGALDSTTDSSQSFKTPEEADISIPNTEVKKEEEVKEDELIIAPIPVETLANILGRSGDDESFLGRGTFGKVFKYTCPVTRQTVALKHLISANVARCGDIADKFERELTVHRVLEHRNILQFLGVIRRNTLGGSGVMVLVLELAQRGSLHSLMEKGGLERNKILGHIIQILRGIHYLHGFSDGCGRSQPIVHRDLRCSNILVSADNTLKIADFGLCKPLHDMAQASGVNSQIGNPFWNGPELLERKKLRNLCATDIWSLGVVILELYYCGARRVPFINHYEIVQYVYKLGAGWVPKIPPRAPREIKQLLDHCFQYDASKRPSATFLINTINNFDFRKHVYLEINDPVKTVSSEFTDDSPDFSMTLTSDWCLVDDITQDPLDPDSDENYLTFRFDRKLEAKRQYMEDRQISRLSELTLSLMPFTSREAVKLTLEDCYQVNGTYLIKNAKTDEEILTAIFDENGKFLKLKQRDSNIFSIDLVAPLISYLSTADRGGIAQINSYSKLQTSLTKKRLKVKSVTLEGAHMLEALSPTPTRQVHGHCSPTFSTQTSVLSLQYDNRTLAVKKNRGRNAKHTYTIKFKENKAVMGHFSLTKTGCDILVEPDSNFALAATVVSYFYRIKSSRKKKTFKDLFSFNRSGSYSAIDS